MLSVREAHPGDRDATWAILEPTIRAGETYTLPRDMNKAEALSYWFADQHEVFVAENGGAILGTYFLQANQRGGGAHVANCGYMTASDATGRGVGRMMCEHSLDTARRLGFRAMQFNFVVSTNLRVIALWQRLDHDDFGSSRSKSMKCDRFS